MTKINDQYQLIIGGGGASGLSLAYYLSKQDLKGRKVLVIERENKNTNDRTWCSWVAKDDELNRLATKVWNNLDVFNKDVHVPFELNEYCYRMIRSADFYAEMHSTIDSSDQVNLVKADIKGHATLGGKVEVTTSEGTYRGDHYFQGFVTQDMANKAKLSLAQHFKGWFVKTDGAFDSTRGTLMDFRIEDGSDCRFMYVLPIDSDHALVEVAIFSNDILESDQYDVIIAKYMSDFLKLEAEDYEILEEEIGVIPMNDNKYHDLNSEQVTYIGEAGGSVKASSGYAFSRIIDSMRLLAQDIGKGGAIKPRVHSTKKYRKYDQTLLHILIHRPEVSGTVFGRLFDRNDPEKILKFLDEKTNLAEEVKIMSSTDISLFLPSFMKVVAK